MNWKGFLLDHMGHFSVYDVPNLIFAILVAAALAIGCGKFGLRIDAKNSRVMAIWAAVSAFGVGLVKGQLAFAVILAALLLFVKSNETNGLPKYVLFLAMVIGLGCGSGASLITALVCIPVALLLRLMQTAN